MAGDLPSGAQHDLASPRMEADLADLPRVLESLPRRLADIVAAQSLQHAVQPALRDGGREWTFLALHQAIEHAAQQLAEAKVRSGDRVLILGENCAALVMMLFAVTRLDAWAVLVNPRLSAREIDAIRDHCTPRRIVYVAHDGTGCDLHPWRCAPSRQAGASPFSGGRAEGSCDAIEHARRHGAEVTMTLASNNDVVLGYIDEQSAPEPVFDDPARQVAALVYTSGTTGNPKGVMLTHRNLLFIAKVSSTLRCLGPTDCVYGVLPISHVYGLASVCLGTLYAGACLALSPRFSPHAMLDALARGGITVVQGVPAMYARLNDILKSGAHSLIAPRLRFIYAGGSPLDPALKAETELRFGRVLHNGYGLTESSPTIAQTRIDQPRIDCSVGFAIPGVELRIVAADGGDVPEGGTGELLVRGPNVMLGYYRDEPLTRSTVDRQGWLRTGDLARREDDGALFIVGRLKELIIRSGFNVYPAEVEAVLNAHPAVRHSAVVGRKVPGNEEVVAFVELAAGAVADNAPTELSDNADIRVTAVDLGRFAQSRLAPYKRPAEIIILAALPASSTGKILKQQLQCMAADSKSVPIELP